MHMRIIGIAVLVCSITTFAFAVEPVVTATHGAITKIDKAAKTFAVKTADGAEHVFYWAKGTSVHGMEAADVAATDSWHGLKEGSEVVAHSTMRGAKDTACAFVPSTRTRHDRFSPVSSSGPTRV